MYFSLRKKPKVKFQITNNPFTQVLSNIDGFIKFNIYTSGNSSIYKHKTANIAKTIKLKTNRFDSIGLVAPDLLVIDAQSSEFEILQGFGQNLSKTKYIIFETGFYSIYDTEKNFDFCNSFLKNLGFTFLATNVSGRGTLRFYFMRLRGLFYYFRKYGFRGLKQYSGFFDVLFVNKLVTIT